MKPINHKRHSILSLTITALLTAGVVNYMEMGYADSEKSEKSGDNKTPTSSSGTHSPDSDYRGKSGESKKITVCHVPKGNPANRHTIHIGYSAWPAHRDNHGGDYLGSCTKTPAPGSTTSTSTSTTTTTPGGTSSTTSGTVGETRVITNCSGTYKENLISKVQSYFEPVVVEDSALKDDKDSETVVTALSQCLDAGDSSDSSDGKKDNRGHGKGDGHDSVSDSGKHHIISGCKSKESNDSNGYRNKLKKEDSGYKNKHKNDHGYAISHIVTDSSLDDSGVWKEYMHCVSDSHGKVDPTKVKLGQGDSGHKYRIVKGCDNDSSLSQELEKHKERVSDLLDAKYKTRPIVLTTTSLGDAAISVARDECIDPVKGGGTETIVPGTTPPTGGTTTPPTDGTTTPPAGGTTTPPTGGTTTPPAGGTTTPPTGGTTTPPTGGTTTPPTGGTTTPPSGNTPTPPTDGTTPPPGPQGNTGGPTGTGTTPTPSSIPMPKPGQSGRLNWREITNPK